MIYFSHFAQRVVGAEIVEKAVLQFFFDNRRLYQRIGNRFISGNITIFCCDLFGLTTDDVGPVDVVYDRASAGGFTQFHADAVSTNPRKTNARVRFNLFEYGCVRTSSIQPIAQRRC